MAARPKALLFDIGGVCVVSPFQAILDYEAAHDIPRGWVNHAISASAPDGSWQRLERGEIPLDAAFFAAFAADLANPALWPAYWRKHHRRDDDDDGGAGRPSEEERHVPPPPPQIDTPALFWEMMRVSRVPDPHMYPALLRLRAASSETNAFVLGALSNTVVFPAGIRDETGAVFDSRLRLVDANDDGVGNGDVKALFHAFVSSAHVGLRKPDPAIYALALRRLDAAARACAIDGGIKPEDVLFLDDIGQNLRAAKALGMRTLKVELGKSWKAVRELESIMGLRLLEDGEKARL